MRELVARGDDVAVLSRTPARVRAGRGVQWDGRTRGAWYDEVAAADAIVNVVGENLGEGRWTDARKKRLVASRIDATHAIVEALRAAPPRERVLVQNSAVGFYGPREDEPLDEQASHGTGFLADLVVRWEAAAREAESLARLVILRFAVLIAADGGALKKMLLPFKLGLGGPIGGGRQWMSWIDHHDALRLILWAIDNRNVRGVYNAAAPEPVRNRDFTRALGRALHRPAFIPVPAFALRLLFGQMAEETILNGQRALPVRAAAEGFEFESKTVEQALTRYLRTA